MIGRRLFGPLGQFLELAPEDIIHAEHARKPFSDVQTMSSSRIKINFLENQDVGILRRKKICDAGVTKPAVDVPVDDSNRVPKPELPAEPREVACQDVVHAGFIAQGSGWLRPPAEP